MEQQQLWDLLRALGRWGQPWTHWDLAAHTGSFWGHVFFLLVWISTLPHRGVLSNEKWQELQVQLSESPQGLRTPGRHWSLVALSSLLPFPLKETAALSFLHYLHLSVSRDRRIGVGSRGIIDVQFSVG